METLKRFGDSSGVCVLAVAVTLGVFAFDLLLPLGVAGGVLYIAPLLIATFSRNLKCILGFAAAATVLTVAGYGFSRDGGVAWMVVANRAISLFAIWSVAIVAYNWKRADQEHRESEARYRDLFEGANLPIQITSDDRKHLYVNKAYLDLFGYDSVDEVFEYQARAIAPHHRQFVLELASARRRGEAVPSIFEYDIVTKDGRLVPVQVHSRRLVWEGSLSSHRVLVDLTERKKAEAAVQELNRTLEQRVEERTRELQEVQQRLLRRERLATLGQLSATVSHELRNPLGAMRNSIYVLQELLADADDRVVRAVERIDRNITRSTAIIDELADFTRIPERTFNLTGVNGWLEGILDSLPVPDGVTVLRRFHDTELTSPIDAEYLRRAAINLYDNACQAMLNHRRESDADEENILTISTRLAGGQVGISFRDTGPGITDKMRDKIFEPLYSTKAFGVGLGLCIVKQIVEQHGGEVEVVSQLDTGTEIILWIPAQGVAKVA